MNTPHPYLCIPAGPPRTRAPFDPADLHALPDRYLRAMIEGYARFAQPLSKIGVCSPGGAVTSLAWGSAHDNCTVLLWELARRTPTTQHQVRARRRTVTIVRENCPSAIEEGMGL